MSEWLALSEALPELGLARHDIELLALSRLSEEEYDHGHGLISPVGLGRLIEVLQDILDGD